MGNPRLKDLRGPARRNFLRWAGAAGAAFALERSKLMNFLLDEGGSALADEATCGETNRSVHVVSGGGNYAFWQLIWPLVDVAKAANPSFAYHAPGEGFEYAGDRPFYFGPESPFADFTTKTPTRPMTAFLSGEPVVHEIAPFRSVMIDGDIATGTSMFGAITAIQRSTVAILPVIGVAPAALGSAPGAPAIAKVPSADGMVELFNSAASRLILQADQDKALFETYYKALLGLREAAGRPTWARELDVTKSAANVLGKNLRAQLEPTQADFAFYGIPELMATLTLSDKPNETKDRLLNFAKSLIITKKAMALGLTNSVIIGLPRAEGNDSAFTDPHPAFDNMQTLRDTIKFMGQFLDRFYKDLATAKDPACSSQMLDKTTILTVHGDHPHSPLNRSGWPDSTPGNANWIYVMANGYLKTGWFGHAKTDSTADGFDPATGAAVPYNATKQSHIASAAVTYAVAKGDMKKVREFYKEKEELTAIVSKP